MHRKLTHTVAALLLAAAGPAAALPDDSAQEIEFTADTQLIDRQRGVATYEGNVHIVRGGMEFRGDELVLEFADDELVGATMRGTPVRFRQEHEGRAPTEAEARELVYDVQAGEVRLRGGVRVRQAGNEFASEDLRYDVETERVVAAGESESRIRVTIQPRPPAESEPEPEPAP
jgi:lipopolysaccharide export system protein LptA